MTTAQKLQRLFADHGREIAPERAEELVDTLRETFGVLFSAADVEWNEDRIVAAIEKQLRRLEKEQ